MRQDSGAEKQQMKNAASQLKQAHIFRTLLKKGTLKKQRFLDCFLYYVYSLDNSLMVLCCPGGFGLLEGPLHILIGLVAGLHAQVLAVPADAQAPFKGTVA
jgi:hypothetical protein